MGEAGRPRQVGFSPAGGPNRIFHRVKGVHAAHDTTDSWIKAMIFATDQVSVDRYSRFKPTIMLVCGRSHRSIWRQQEGSCPMKQIVSRAERVAQFAERLNYALNMVGIPERGRGAELARLTGLSHQGACKWIDGVGYPGPENIKRIAKNYGISIDWLLTGEGSMWAINPTDDEVKLLMSYRKTDQRGKKIIMSAAEQQDQYQS
jgi:transcriptional regulator with XRE-family HTH domain